MALEMWLLNSRFPSLCIEDEDNPSNRRQRGFEKDSVGRSWNARFEAIYTLLA